MQTLVPPLSSFRHLTALSSMVALTLGASVVTVSACGQDLPAFSIDDASTGNDATSSDGAADVMPDAGIIITPDASLDSGADSMTTGDGDADIADTMVDVWDGYDGFTCDPSQPPSTEPCVIADGYGIFVATGGSASAAGTEAAPVDSITTALTLAQSASKHLIFVCGGGYNGAVSIASTLSVDVKIYGGMSCPTAAGGDGGAAWTYTGAATMVSSGSNQPALKVTGTTHAITIEDVGFVAGDAVNAGDSSIAGWLANASGVTFKRAAFTAGNGVSQPVAGMAPENHYAGTLGGGTPSGTTGSPPNPCACPDGATSSLCAGGGTGGIGPLGGRQRHVHPDGYGHARRLRRCRGRGGGHDVLFQRASGRERRQRRSRYWSNDSRSALCLWVDTG